MQQAPQPDSDVMKVSDLTKTHKPLHFQGEYLFEDLQTTGPMMCEWEIRPETAGFSIRGDLQGGLVLECARCLAPYTIPIGLQLNEQYVLDQYIDPFEREKELQAEDFFEVVGEEDTLDLKDLVHQLLILESANQTTCGQAECDFTKEEPPSF